MVQMGNGETYDFVVVDEPTDLPEGTEIELLALDLGDWLDETNRAALQRGVEALAQ